MKYESNTSEELLYLLQFKKALRDTLKTQLSGLESDIRELESRVPKPGNAIIATDKTGRQTQDIMKYQTDWTWGKKILYALHYSDKPLTSTAIMEVMEKVEQNILGYASNANNTISVHLRNLVKQHRVETYKVKGERGYFYGLPGWFEADNKLKEEYRAKLSIL